MRLLRRKRRKPDLVIPVPVLGPTTVRQQLATEEAELDGNFLWGFDYQPRQQTMIALPRDLRALSALHQGIRPPREGEYRPNVTYDPAEATESLLRAALPQPDQRRTR